MGPYCKFCDFRCFVPRLLPFKTETLLMATCLAGMAHDRKATGHDHTTAVKPRTVPEPCCDSHIPTLPATGRHDAIHCCDPNDCGPCCENCPDCPTIAKGSARTLAVTLEGQVAALVERMGVAYGIVVGAVSCECVADESAPQCLQHRLLGLLDTEWLNVAGMDRLYDAIVGAIAADIEGAAVSGV